MVPTAARADHLPMTDERHDPTGEIPEEEPVTEAAPAGDAPTQEAPAAGETPPARGGRFLRSRDERVVGGVSGGLAKLLGVDPWLVRLGFVLTAFFGGAGIIAYLVALAFVPEDRGDGTAAEMPPLTGPRILQGLALVVLGIAAIAVLDGGLGLGWFFGPSLLALGLLAVVAYGAYRGLTRLGGAGGQDSSMPTAARIAGATLLTLALLCVAGIGAMTAFWLAATGNGTAGAVLVIALGLTAVVTAFFRPVRWLAPVALVIALPVAVVAAADLDLDGGIGERTYRPAVVADIPADGYDLGVGELVVDLRELEWPRSGEVRVKVDLGMGHALVLVPRGVCLRVHGDLGMGGLTVLDEDSGGIDVDQVVGRMRPSDSPRLIVDGTVGIGHLEVDTRPGDGDFFDGRRDRSEPPVRLAPGVSREQAASGDCDRS